MGIDQLVTAVFFNLTEGQTAEVVRLIGERCEKTFSNVRVGDISTDRALLALGGRSNLQVMFAVAWPRTALGARYQAEQICVAVTKESGYVHNIPPKEYR